MQATAGTSNRRHEPVKGVRTVAGRAKRGSPWRGL